MSSIYDVWTSRFAGGDKRLLDMLQVVPDAPVVDREAFILERCAGKRVLNIGCNGTDGKGRLHARIRTVAEECFGVDKDGADYNIDIDVEPGELAAIAPSVRPSIIVCGEVLEHLANPGGLLRFLREMYPAEIIITVPNAFSHVAARWNLQGRECVNVDHVCWYSYHTLKVLVERYGYTVAEWYWYNGEPRTAEGLVFVVRPT